VTSLLTLLPAIDLMGGRCVRLSQGVASEKTEYSEDPVAVAREFQAQGAEWIHLVDLDGAFKGESKNWKVIQAIRAAVDLRLELGGGMRDRAAVQRMLDAGIDRAVVGTWAARDPEAVGRLAAAQGERIAVGVDARDGRVAVRGWTEVTDLSAEDFAAHLAGLGVKTLIVTDIATDGMLTGPNTAFLRRMAARVPGVALIASGGISETDDLRALRDLALPNLRGVIVGRAIYAGRMTVRAALEALGFSGAGGDAARSI
jgi:phosphoribosylformimino-5-aminoimidazole carboxamide ribotide isomerase